MTTITKIKRNMFDKGFKDAISESDYTEDDVREFCLDRISSEIVYHSILKNIANFGILSSFYGTETKNGISVLKKPQETPPLADVRRYIEETAPIESLTAITWQVFLMQDAQITNESARFDQDVIDAYNVADDTLDAKKKEKKEKSNNGKGNGNNGNNGNGKNKS